MVQKIYSKMHPVSCTNIHHEVTDLINHGMVENTKTWMSWEQYLTFPQNKKIITLFLRWHILRSYCFIAEVTFKYNIIDYCVMAKNSFIKPGESCPHWLKITLWKELGHLVQKCRVACYLKTFSLICCQTHFWILFEIWE